MMSAMSTDDVRRAALAQLRAALALVASTDSPQSGTPDDEIREALYQVHKGSCSLWVTDAQLEGDDPSVAPETDSWLLGYQVALGLVFGLSPDPGPCAEGKLKWLIRDLHYDLRRPKAAGVACL